MPTIEEHEQNMTLFFSKSTGDITHAVGGMRDMNVFHKSASDFSIIWDLVVKPLDENVLNNSQNFKINLETKEIEILPSAVSQYPIASTQ